jgi:hypothetical protein
MQRGIEARLVRRCLGRNWVRRVCAPTPEKRSLPPDEFGGVLAIPRIHQLEDENA